MAIAAQQMASVTRGSSGTVTLFVEILNKLIHEFCIRYLYFFGKGNPQITGAAMQGLVELIKTEMQSDSTNVSPAPDGFFSSTLRYIQFQKQKGGVIVIFEDNKVWG
ncbi:vacuolar protein sorting-associated protein 35B isoform X2 [Prunus yedoensis var. nudiflora]|uniref:Vacuolar protein sorting-associated protein 35B isoform X2 n=1 Tax=Prunus yedoensis var. nudiflora TaxID=2094558 RepID=A0A314ZWC9_PRUYE|nr:vacuolar protein sorting-associated protein 35B isoform X2 [Prunus yedoensis var. nudiflora]